MWTDINFIIWMLCYILVLGGLSAYGIHRYFIIYLYEKHKRSPMKPKGQFEELPLVTVQLPLYNELYVVERLLKSVSELDYPREKLQIQVLDDSTDETVEISRRCVKQMQSDGFDIELIHRTDRTGFKAGALDNGLKTALGEYIFILDADFLPKPGMLKQTIHYFTEPGIAMIQTRWGHINRGYSLLTRVQAMYLDGHLLLEQTARSRSGRFFNFNGTGGIWRRSAIEDAGGWEHDTLTEDLDLSYRAQLKGWKFVFLPELVTPAELPVDMNGFKSQQHRWTKGSIQTCKKMLPRVWKSKFPLWIKLESTFHLTSNFAFLLLLCLCVLIHPAFQPATSGLVRFWDIPVFIAASLSVTVFYFYAQMQLYPKTWFREVLLTPFVLALGIGLSINNARAVLEAVFNKQSDFNRTPKFGITGSKPKEGGTATGSATTPLADGGLAARYLPTMSLKQVMPLIELALAGYFTGFVLYLIRIGAWTSVPFVILFPLGFAYVAIGPLRQWIEQGRRQADAPVDPSSGDEPPQRGMLPA